jgi:hypothetical protein
MVYDGMKSGMNSFMWVPWFAVPTVESQLCFVGKLHFFQKNCLAMATPKYYGKDGAEVLWV